MLHRYQQQCANSGLTFQSQLLSILFLASQSRQSGALDEKSNSVPISATVLLNEMGTEFDCTLVAGHIGMVVGAQTGEDYPPVVGKGDTLMPAPQWFFFIKEKVRDDGYVIDDE